MDLDNRINSKSDILTCFDIEEAKSFIGQKGYFEDYFDVYKSLEDNVEYGTLTEVLNGEAAFESSNGCHWRFFLPESRLKIQKKELRPYKILEFQLEFCVGKPIKFRMKDVDTSEKYLVLLGYSLEKDNDGIWRDRIHIGNSSYSLKELFENYEWQNDSNVWKPFGTTI